MSKGVLGKIGDAVASGAEAVAEAGASAVEAVGDLLPAGKTAPKKKASTKTTTKAKAPKPKAESKAPKASEDHAMDTS